MTGISEENQRQAWQKKESIWPEAAKMAGLLAAAAENI